MKRTVLIVEDAELCRDTLEVVLMKLPGLRIQSVPSAEEALLCLDAGEICALVTDLHLPHMDGFELIETVRSKFKRLALPILVISGDTDPHIPARVTGLGANAFFPKPYSPSDVRNTLARLIHMQSLPA